MRLALVLPLFLAGCASVTVPPLARDNPANPDAAIAPVASPAPLLQSYQPAPPHDTQTAPGASTPAMPGMRHGGHQNMPGM